MKLCRTILWNLFTCSNPTGRHPYFHSALQEDSILTDPRIIEPFSTFDLKHAELTNTFKPGFQVGFGVERYLKRKLLMNVELYLAMDHYEFKDKINYKQETKEVTYDEKLYQIELPLTLSYEFTINKIHYVARAGFSAAKISLAKGQPSRKFSQDVQAITGANQDITAYRRQMLYSGIIGAGIRYKVPRGVVSLDLRAKIGFNNIVVRGKRWDNQVLYDRYYYLDDDFSLNTLSLSASYYFSFYSPRKQR